MILDIVLPDITLTAITILIKENCHLPYDLLIPACPVETVSPLLELIRCKRFCAEKGLHITILLDYLPK